MNYQLWTALCQRRKEPLDFQNRLFKPVQNPQLFATFVDFLRFLSNFCTFLTLFAPFHFFTITSVVKRCCKTFTLNSRLTKCPFLPVNRRHFSSTFCSWSSNLFFILIPPTPEKPPDLPLLQLMRWQGIISASGFLERALPTARAALGLPILPANFP